MMCNTQERRKRVRLTSVIDEALDLAEECGWRYAIAYLISEEVPSPIIQRILSGGGRTRRAWREPNLHAVPWKGKEAESMQNLFDSLEERRTADIVDCDDLPWASRSSVRQSWKN